MEAVEGQKGRDNHVSLRQIVLDLCLKTDQKQKMDCYTECTLFKVYPQELCFSWKKLLSSWQMKPSVKLSKRGTTSPASLVEIVLGLRKLYEQFSPHLLSLILYKIRNILLVLWIKTKNKQNFQSQNYLVWKRVKNEDNYLRTLTSNSCVLVVWTWNVRHFRKARIYWYSSCL